MTSSVDDPKTTADFAVRRGEEGSRARPGRSKRGLSGVVTSQCCFRLEVERHHALKLHCIQNRLEVGELISELLRKHIGI